MKFDTRLLSWQGNRLYRPGSDRPLLRLEPDAALPHLWRVRRPDGTLSDETLNRERAKEEALDYAARYLRGGSKSSVLRAQDEAA